MDLTQDRKKLKELYQPPVDEFTLVDVPELPFAVIDGKGPPDRNACERVVKDLFTVIYPIRRTARERMGRTFVEAPLEMLYWADDSRDLVAGRKEHWKWRAMITLPVWTDAAMFSSAVAQAQKQAAIDPSAPRLELFHEGRCAQILLVGQEGEVPALLTRLYSEFLPKKGLEPTGAYHEIYLDDWNRVWPRARKIILRQAVRPATAV